MNSWVQDSPLGPLRVAVTGAGVRSVRYGAEGAGGDGRPHPAVAAALAAYFAGDLAAVDALPVDLEGRTPFSRSVLSALRRVGAGRLTTYGALAAGVGRPGASRAVGGVMAANPVPVVIPCHRVVAAGGALGGYAGGLAVKGWLLAHEGHHDAPWATRPQGSPQNYLRLPVTLICGLRTVSCK